VTAPTFEACSIGDGRPARGRGARGRAPRRPGADVDEPSAGLEALDDRVDRRTDRIGATCGRIRNCAVLVVDQVHELRRRAEIEVVQLDTVPLRRSDSTRQRLRHRLPNERRVGRRELRHVPARLVAPGPDIVDSGSTGRSDRRLQLGYLLACEPEARQPHLRVHAVTGGCLAEQPREAPDEGFRRLVEVLPVGIGRQQGEVR
jgi:hypothetical protein